MSDTPLKDPTVKQSGFEPLDGVWEPLCTHHEHNAPTHLVVPPGQQYRHVCPKCGNEQVIRPVMVAF